VALIDTNKKVIAINGQDVSFIEDPRLQVLAEYYRLGLISFEEFNKYYCAFPFQIEVGLEPAICEVPEPIKSRFDILDIR